MRARVALAQGPLTLDTDTWDSILFTESDTWFDVIAAFDSFR